MGSGGSNAPRGGSNAKRASPRDTISSTKPAPRTTGTSFNDFTLWRKKIWVLIPLKRMKSDNRENRLFISTTWNLYINTDFILIKNWHWLDCLIIPWLHSENLTDFTIAGKI